MLFQGRKKRAAQHFNWPILKHDLDNCLVAKPDDDHLVTEMKSVIARDLCTCYESALISQLLGPYIQSYQHRRQRADRIWPVRRESHYGENDSMNVTTNYWSHLHSTKRKYQTSYFCGLPSLNFTASCHFPRVQESPSKSRMCLESPSESEQEPCSTVDITLVVTLDPSAFPAPDSFTVISSRVLGSSKGAEILGERCVPLVEKHGRIYPAWEDKQ